MSNQSVAVYEKPLPHCSLSDWLSKISHLKVTAESKREDSFALRHASRNVRNELDIKTEWNTYFTNARLLDRTNELDLWFRTMVECLNRVMREMNLLQEEKDLTEKDMEALILPLKVLSDCLSTRDSRLETELTHDECDTQLRNELSITENNQKMLRGECIVAWEKLKQLQDVRMKLELELCNKKEATEIEVDQLNLDQNCSKISLKPDVMAIPRNSLTYEGWLEYTKCLKKLAENEMIESYRVRESLFVVREKSKNLIRAQQDRTNHVFRIRIFETQRARNELEWQSIKNAEELSFCLKEIQNLEECYDAKLNVAKLAQTRLRNRSNRSGMELCVDEVHRELCSEITEVQRTKDELMNKIILAKKTYNDLELHADRIKLDLEHKQHLLMTDVKITDLRKILYEVDPDSQTERNMILTRLEHELKP